MVEENHWQLSYMPQQSGEKQLAVSDNALDLSAMILDNFENILGIKQECSQDMLQGYRLRSY